MRHDDSVEETGAAMKHHKFQIQSKRESLVAGFMLPAFHAGDRGSNPLGDATTLQWVTLRSVALF